MTTTEDERQVAPEGTPEDPDAIRDRGKDLELRTKRGLHTGRPAYEDFHPAMRKLRPTSTTCWSSRRRTASTRSPAKSGR